MCSGAQRNTSNKPDGITPHEGCLPRHSRRRWRTWRTESRGVLQDDQCRGLVKVGLLETVRSEVSHRGLDLRNGVCHHQDAVRSWFDRHGATRRRRCGSAQFMSLPDVDLVAPPRRLHMSLGGEL